MGYEVLTVLQLPLSFMSAVFGMNNTQFVDAEGNNTMTLDEQLKYTCMMPSPSFPFPNARTLLPC